MAGRRKERLFQFSLYGLDTNLLVVLFFVMIFGFIMIYSASYYTAGAQPGRITMIPCIC